MFKTALLALLCLALRCTVIALPLLEAHMAPATAMLPPPIHQPPTLDNPEPMYQLPLRNRRMLTVAYRPSADDETDPSRKLWRNVKNPPTRKPTAEEAEEIHYYLSHYPNGKAYIFDDTGILLEKPKESCDPSYYCGRVEFYGKDGSLLHSTRCCFWNSSTCTPKLNNGAECLISAGITCCPIIFGAIGASQKAGK